MKTTNKEVRVMEFGTVVTVSWKGLKTGIFVGSRGGVSFVVADLDGQGVRCRRVFSNLVHKADGVIGVDKALEKGFKSWCKEHGKEPNLKLVKPIAESNVVKVAVKKTLKKATPKAKAEPKTNPQLATVAEALAKGGMKPADVAKVLKALM